MIILLGSLELILILILLLGFSLGNLYINIIRLGIQSRIGIWIVLGLSLSLCHRTSPIFGIISVSVSIVSDRFVFWKHCVFASGKQNSISPL